MQDSKTHLGALTQYTNTPHWVMEERLPTTLVVNTPKPKPFPPSHTPPTQNSLLLLQQLPLPLLLLLQLFLVTKLLPWNAQELIFLKLTHYTNTSFLDVEDILLLPLVLFIVTKLLPVGYSRTHFEAHPLHKYIMS
jgi:hypothetical protein